MPGMHRVVVSQSTVAKYGPTTDDAPFTTWYQTENVATGDRVADYGQIISSSTSCWNLSPDLEGKLSRAAGRRGLAQIDAGQVLTHDAVGDRLEQKLTEHQSRR